MNSKDDDDIYYAFVMQSEVHFKNVWKWIMDLGSSKYMALYRLAFDTYKVIAPHNVYLNDDGVVETIGMGSIDV